MEHIFDAVSERELAGRDNCAPPHSRHPRLGGRGWKVFVGYFLSFESPFQGSYLPGILTLWRKKNQGLFAWYFLSYESFFQGSQPALSSLGPRAWSSSPPHTGEWL